MASICYLVNSFPEPSESYISREIIELRRRGHRVVPCAFRGPRDPRLSIGHGALYVFPLTVWTSLKASWICFVRLGSIIDLVLRALGGPESYRRRLRTLGHMWLGAYLSVVLKGEGADHIHVHHGFFSSWCGMVGARLLGVDFSMTLHGSDLLVRADYLDCKLKNCSFCVTVSDYNRNHILERYAISTRKVAVHRLGVDLGRWRPSDRSKSAVFTILNVGRLHAVKNQAFLVLACHSLKTANVAFHCKIVGEGEERLALQRLVDELDLDEQVQLLGQVDAGHLHELYAQADVVVLTSISEGLPVALTEAMAMQSVVLAPAITGIPELITSGETGFLYQPGSMDDFLAKLSAIRMAGQNLDQLRSAARRHIERNYDSERNVALFASDFLERVNHGAQPRASLRETDEDSLLQQIQLRV